MLKLPISYSLRNLGRRKRRTLATISGVAIIIFACTLMLSLSRGLFFRINVTGEERNVLAISKFGQNIMFSSISNDEIVYLNSLSGLTTDASGNPLVSAETMHMPLAKVEGQKSDEYAPVYVRGVDPIAYEVHKSVNIAEGRLPEDSYELLAGCTSYIKLGIPKEKLKPGLVLSFEGNDWTVCGIFKAGGSLIESEIWAKGDDLRQVLRRRTHTFVVARLDGRTAVDDAVGKFSQTGVLERYFKGWSEKVYYKSFGSALGWVFWISIVMVITISVAGVLIGANTMYTAVMNRMREIATYKVLGFTNGDILMSLMTESILLACVGGIVGIIAGTAVNGLPLKLSYGAFFLVVDGLVVGITVLLAVTIGLIGGIIPVIKGLRMTIVDGLKN